MVVAMLILQAAKETVEMSILMILAASDVMHCLIRLVKIVTHGKCILLSCYGNLEV